MEELAVLTDFFCVAGSQGGAAPAPVPAPAAKAANAPAAKNGKAKAAPAKAAKAPAAKAPATKAPAAAAPAPAAFDAAGLPATERVYLTYEGNFQLSCAATVLACRAAPGAGGAPAVDLVFDVSVFHPQGGGQPSDVGVVRSAANGCEAAVERVSFDFATGVVVHRAAVDVADAFAVGDAVELAVDAAAREAYSRCHTAGHMVDSAMVRAGYALPPTKGYHFLDAPYVEYKGDVPAAERDALVARLKAEFAGLVDEDIATTIEMMEKARAEARLNKVQQNFDFSVFKDPTVRVVGVAGFQCPCGGTHVKSTGSLRDYTVVGIKVKKGVVRIKYDRANK